MYCYRNSWCPVQDDDDDDRHEMTWVILYCVIIAMMLSGAYCHHNAMLWRTAADIIKVFNGQTIIAICCVSIAILSNLSADYHKFEYGFPVKLVTKFASHKPTRQVI